MQKHFVNYFFFLPAIDTAVQLIDDGLSVSGTVNTCGTKKKIALAGKKYCWATAAMLRRLWGQ